MVSRYRDIIETNQSSLSRTQSFLSTTTSGNLRNGSIRFLIRFLDYFSSESSADGHDDTASINGVTSIVSTTTSNKTVDVDSQSVDTEHTQYGKRRMG